MNEWGFIGHETLIVLKKSPPQLINLNNGVAWWQRKGRCFLIHTHHSQTL